MLHISDDEDRYGWITTRLLFTYTHCDTHTRARDPHTDFRRTSNITSNDTTPDQVHDIDNRSHGESLTLA